MSTATDLCPASLADMTMADPAVNACPYAYYAGCMPKPPCITTHAWGCGW